MRAALYARVSTEAQADRGTIGSQLALLREHVAAAGDELVGEYVDDDLRIDAALLRIADLTQVVFGFGLEIQRGHVVRGTGSTPRSVSTRAASALLVGSTMRAITRS
jgi:hypothetical protein